MSKSPWLHVDRIPEAGETVALDRDEARHGGRANRLRAGDAVVLSDGRGTTAPAELLTVSRRETLARVAEHSEHAPETPPIHLASALPKGDRVATLLSMATQLGITSFTPLECKHSVVVPSEGSRARWERVVRENAKQSRRPWAPEVRAEQTPDDVLGTLPGAAAWLLDPGAEALLDAVPQDGQTAQVLLVGPESGFSDGERRSLIAAGATPRALGRGILRIETAGVAAVAVLRARLTR